MSRAGSRRELETVVRATDVDFFERRVRLDHVHLGAAADDDADAAEHRTQDSLGNVVPSFDMSPHTKTVLRAMSSLNVKPRFSKTPCTRLCAAKLSLARTTA